MMSSSIVRIAESTRSGPQGSRSGGMKKQVDTSFLVQLGAGNVERRKGKERERLDVEQDMNEISSTSRL